MSTFCDRQRMSAKRHAHPSSITVDGALTPLARDPIKLRHVIMENPVLLLLSERLRVRAE
jgi:hypothetical protein